MWFSVLFPPAPSHSSPTSPSSTNCSSTTWNSTSPGITRNTGGELTPSSCQSLGSKHGKEARRESRESKASPKFTRFLELYVSTSVWGGCISYFIKSLDGHHRWRLSNTDNFPILTYLKGHTLFTDPPGCCWLFASSPACFQGVQQQEGEHQVNGALWSSLSQSSLHHNAWNCSPFHSGFSPTHWDRGNQERGGGGGKVTIQKIRSFDCCA